MNDQYFCRVDTYMSHDGGSHETGTRLICPVHVWERGIPSDEVRTSSPPSTSQMREDEAGSHEIDGRRDFVFLLQCEKVHL